VDCQLTLCPDSVEEQARFAADPEYFRRYRKGVESHFNRGWAIFYKGSAAQKEAQDRTVAHYKEVFHDDELKDFMTPSFGVGCRRPTTGDTFIKAIQAPNVTVFKHGVDKMCEEGIIGPDGTIHKYDAIVCATGFDTSFTPRFPVHGRNGHELRNDFSNSPEAYLGLAVHGYPNFFMFSGPISPVGNGSAFPGAEGTAEYIAKFLAKMQKKGIRTFEVEQKPQDDFNDWVQERMKTLVWTDDCGSWCKFVLLFV
jgi:cation diffusion facilitator CzcD-associated flavoprotein CzcO